MTEPTRPQRVAEATVDALHRGDRHAFEELYMQLHVNVYNLAARIVGDRSEAEDITQEVFLRAFRHLPGTDGPLRPEAWVFRTTVNACYDHLRRRKPAPALLFEANEAAAHDGFEQSATAAAVEQALAAINPRYRTALVLKDLHGLGNGEIAEIMGVARGTVGVLLFRARSSFEKRYREVAPTLGAGLPVAGLAAWLPTLPVPAALQTPPAFLAPLTAPIAATPLAPAVASVSVAPLTAGLAKLAGALTTKLAVVAIAATAVTSGTIAVHEIRNADRPYAPEAAAAAPAPAGTADYDDWQPHALTHGAAHGDLARGIAGHAGGGGGLAGARNGASVASGGGTQTRDGAGSSSDGVSGSGTQTRSGDGSTDAGASGVGSGTGTGTGTGSAGGDTGVGQGAGDGSGGVGAGATAGGTITGGTSTGGTTTGGTTGGGTTTSGTGGGDSVR